MLIGGFEDVTIQRFLFEEVSAEGEQVPIKVKIVDSHFVDNEGIDNLCIVAVECYYCFVWLVLYCVVLARNQILFFVV